MPSNQDVGSSILPCTTAATIATATWINSLHGYSAPHWISCDFAMFQMFSFPVEPNPACLVCRNSPRSVGHTYPPPSHTHRKPKNKSREGKARELLHGGFTGLHARVLLGYTTIYWDIQPFTGIYNHLLAYTTIYWDIQAFTHSYSNTACFVLTARNQVLSWSCGCVLWYQSSQTVSCFRGNTCTPRGMDYKPQN